MLNFFSYIDSTIVIILMLLVYLIGVIVYFFLRSLFKRKKITHKESSILLSFYSKDQLIQNMASGKVNSMHYSLLMTTTVRTGTFKDTLTDSGALIYVLELPFNTQAHIVGLGKDYPDDLFGLGEFLKIRNFELVALEGDFSNYFSLYAKPDQQTKTRYIFDPAAMQFVVDYCKTHSWEIVGDEMYFSVGHDQKGGDLINKSIEFVKQIQPALVKLMPGDEPVKHEAPYGEHRGGAMKCPVCKAEMTESEHWHECPLGHGKLLFGNDLLAIRSGKVKDISRLDDSDVNTTGSLEGSIACPQCSTPMTRINYQYTGIIIDTCLKCHYRWCDSGELAKIAPKLD